MNNPQSINLDRGTQGDEGHFVTIEHHVVFIKDDTGSGANGRGGKFTKHGLEKKLIAHHESRGGFAVHEHRGAMAEDSGGDLMGRSRFTFHKSLPGEVRKHIENNPAARKLFRVTSDAKVAKGADALASMGDKYFDMADEAAGSHINAALDTASKSDDPEARFHAAMYKELPKTKTQQGLISPDKLREGHTFTINGRTMKVVNDAGTLTLDGGSDWPSTPVQAMSEIPIDKHSLKMGKKSLNVDRETIPFSRVLELSQGNLFGNAGGGSQGHLFAKQQHEGKDGHWVTMHGRHVFIRDGESVQQALERGGHAPAKAEEKKPETTPGNTGKIGRDEVLHQEQQKGEDRPTAGQAIKRGMSYAAWRTTHNYEGEGNSGDYLNAKDVNGQHVYTSTRKWGKVVDVADDAKTVTVEHSDGSKSQHSPATLTHMSHQADHVTRPGYHDPDAHDYVGKTLGKEAFVNGENISKTMQRHGLDPVKHRSFRQAIADGYQSLKDAKPGDDGFSSDTAKKPDTTAPGLHPNIHAAAQMTLAEFKASKQFDGIPGKFVETKHGNAVAIAIRHGLPVSDAAVLETADRGHQDLPGGTLKYRANEIRRKQREATAPKPTARDTIDATTPNSDEPADSYDFTRTEARDIKADAVKRAKGRKPTDEVDGVLKAADKYTEKGENYNRNIADPAARIRAAMGRGHAKDSSVVTGLVQELKGRMDGMAKPMPTSHTEAGDLGIYTVQSGGKTMYSVHDAKSNPRGFGDSMHETVDAAEQEKAIIQRDRSEADKRQAERAIKEKAAAAAKAKYDDTDGYADSLSPVAKGKALKTLNEQFNYKGRGEMSRKENIRLAISKGATIKPWSDGQDRVVMSVTPEHPLDTGERAVSHTKTEVEYARHLLAKRSR